MRIYLLDVKLIYQMLPRVPCGYLSCEESKVLCLELINLRLDLGWC